MDTAIDGRLRAVLDMSVSDVRENCGLHEYDGRLQDLSATAVAAGLSRLGTGPARNDPHDEAHLAAFETGLRTAFGHLELHRRNPLLHLEVLDVSGYDRPYAPRADRLAARTAHLRGWPDAIDVAVSTLDQVPAPVAASLLPSVRALAGGLDAQVRVEAAALAALPRLVEHLESIAAHGSPEVALGGTALAALMGSTEALDVDLGVLTAAADRERDRLGELLRDACARVDPDRPIRDLVADLLADHPDPAGVATQARAQVAEVIAFCRERHLVPWLDGECLVGPPPPSKSWSMAAMAWAAPGEPDGPSAYWVTPPDPSWPEHEQEEWLSVFSATTLPAITVHEVAPGHFAHGRALRRVSGAERRTLLSMSFAEGWAHYAEEMCVEEGLRKDDPRFTVGVALEALIRVTRLRCAIGLHTGAMNVEDATQRFVEDALQSRAAAAAEARRGTFDPTYGRYTWGKLALLELREQARAQWATGFDLPRFHRALLALGSPPLGLIGTALERG